ncbi:uncharacterized protein LAJ45_05366 [Morchella importuna]|uniref:uncharacterized protein n=1 Tax=Morchella importuna TaxID=1174673 RepID=UPI001E8D09B5|nr:uncharacterized protein LAJ45_05366 [Morchella importuna]KAH8150670.1 hypothetical protein LAJ45_05366 [Morchella importuna]
MGPSRTEAWEKPRPMTNNSCNNSHYIGLISGTMDTGPKILSKHHGVAVTSILIGRNTRKKQLKDMSTYTLCVIPCLWWWVRGAYGWPYVVGISHR